MKNRVEMTSRKKMFCEQLIKKSESNDYHNALDEWDLCDTYKHNDLHQIKSCICGKRPITNICVMKNKYNNNFIKVGNVCVNKFFDIDTTSIFDGLHKINKNINQTTPIKFINYCHTKKLINDWEFNFYKDVYRKRKLSDRQKDIIKKINTKLRIHFNEVNKNYTKNKGSV